MTNNEFLDEIEQQVKAAVLASGQKKCYVDFSAYEDVGCSNCDNDYLDEVSTAEMEEEGRAETTYINNLNKVAIVGVCIIYHRGKVWTRDNELIDSPQFISKVIESPTWLDLCVVFNRAIRFTRDKSHYFLEGVELYYMRKGIPVYRIIAGS